MKINWKQKLTSRKLWMALTTLITGLIIAFGGRNSDAQTVSGCIMSLGSVIAYILGEGMVDSARITDSTDGTDGREDDTDGF